MSRFTTEVRFICENASGLSASTGFNDVESVLDASVESIFNFPFPIFDENYRIPLEKKILRHYYTREICEETVGLWKLRLSQKLNEIMPYYNQLYSSELIRFNPLYDVDLTTRHNRENNGTSALTNTHNDTTTIDRDTTENNTHTDTTTFERDETLNNTHADTTVLDGENSLTNTHNDTDTATKWDVYSDTPQGALTNVDNNTYLTNARKITDNKTNQGGYTNAGTEDSTTTNNGTFANTAHEETETTNNGGYSNTGTDDSTTVNNGGYNNSGTSRNTEDYLQTVIGKTAGKTYSKMLLEFRETFLNIDAMILRDLSNCFFGLWE